MPAEGLNKFISIAVHKCIGCLACRNACPRNHIIHMKQGAKLTISFARTCEELDCNRCVAICSERAVSISVGYGDAGNDPQMVSFDLVPCSGCGEHFIPEGIFDRLRSSLASRYGAEPEELNWLRLCPKCKRRQVACKPIELPRAAP